MTRFRFEVIVDPGVPVGPACLVLSSRAATVEAMSTAAASLLVGSLGAVLGAASLTWNITNYLLSGARVKTVLQGGALSDSGNGMITGPVASLTPQYLARLAEQGYSRPILAVEVRNVGRLPVTVNKWGMKCSFGVSYNPLAESIGPKLPHRLEVGESATWAMDLHTAVALARTSSDVLGDGTKANLLFGVVELGNGRTYKTTETIKA